MQVTISEIQDMMPVIEKTDLKNLIKTLREGGKEALDQEQQQYPD